LTGWGLDEDRRRSREAGFDLHLTKPATIEVARELLIRSSRADRQPRTHAPPPAANPKG